MSNKIELSASLEKLYVALSEARCRPKYETTSVPVADLHKAVYGETEIEDVRHMQQRLGSYVTKLNRRLKGHKLAVKPGDRKYTYALTSL